MQEETEQLSTQINALKAGIATEVRLPFYFIQTFSFSFSFHVI
jgi:hypothetical protein